MFAVVDVIERCWSEELLLLPSVEKSISDVHRKSDRVKSFNLVRSFLHDKNTHSHNPTSTWIAKGHREQCSADTTMRFMRFVQHRTETLLLGVLAVGIVI